MIASTLHKTKNSGIIRPLAKIKNLAPDREVCEGEKERGKFPLPFLLFPFPYFCKKSIDSVEQPGNSSWVGCTSALK